MDPMDRPDPRDDAGLEDDLNFDDGGFDAYNDQDELEPFVEPAAKSPVIEPSGPAVLSVQKLMAAHVVPTEPVARQYDN